MNRTETAERARGRADHLGALRADFAKGVATGVPTASAIRIEQTLTLPAQICTGLQVNKTNPMPIEQQFDDAVQSIISSIHTEFRPWAQSAADASVVHRALPRAVHEKTVREDMARLATGELTTAELPTVFGDKVPPTDLWRAVYLLWYFGRSGPFVSMKKHLRAVQGKTRIENNAYASHLLPLIDRPWRKVKADTERQTERAWRNGGPLPKGLLSGSWEPIPVRDFTELIPLAASDQASQTRTNARLTLQVAGGIALVTDKLLLAIVGSAVAAGDVPFRADVDVVVPAWARATWRRYGSWPTQPMPSTRANGPCPATARPSLKKTAKPRKRPTLT